jgi:hypothetical protein
MTCVFKKRFSFNKIKMWSGIAWHNIFLLRLMPPLAALLIKLLMLSCRVVKVEGKERGREALARSDGRAVYATWHQRMSYHSHYFGARHLIVMISRAGMENMPPESQSGLVLKMFAARQLEVGPMP